MSHFDENSFILRENMVILWGLQIISVLELWLAWTALSLSSTYLTRFIKFPFGVLELCPGQKMEANRQTVQLLHVFLC